jgi:hypothetical protein
MNDIIDIYFLLMQSHLKINVQKGYESQSKAYPLIVFNEITENQYTVSYDKEVDYNKDSQERVYRKVVDILFGAAKLISAVVDHVVKAASLVTEQQNVNRQVSFQLSSLGTLPETLDKFSKKWGVDKTEGAQVLLQGAKNLLSPSKIGGILEKVQSNARALGTSGAAVMDAYGKSASTGSSDLLDMNRSYLINHGYGKEVMQAQMKLQAYQQTIAASGNNPLVN